MSRLVIIANPRAHRNRLWPLAAQALKKAAPGATLLETPQEEDLKSAAREVASGKVEVVAIAGGDGTAQRAITELSQACGDKLPPIALLGGGAYDSLADLGRRGAPEVRLKRLSTALASGETLKLDARDTLQVEGQLGFRLGVGLPLRFVEAIYRSGRPGRLMGAWMTLKTIGSSLTHGAFAKALYEPLPVSCVVDGEEWPPVPLYGLVCASVAEAGLGLRPFKRATEQPGFFEVLGLTAGPLAFSLELPPLLLGRPARRDRLLDAVAEHVVLQGRSALPYFLDGEVKPGSKSLTITPGPRVSLVRA
ncbi:MAG: hypothetical protein JST92_02515 [Deltaproteobacteria bacterium]|nr:hypothetical protein [Deltaproteobacteria bacterium]